MYRLILTVLSFRSRCMRACDNGLHRPLHIRRGACAHVRLKMSNHWISLCLHGGIVHRIEHIAPVNPLFLPTIVLNRVHISHDPFCTVRKAYTAEGCQCTVDSLCHAIPCIGPVRPHGDLKGARLPPNLAEANPRFILMALFIPASIVRGHCRNPLIGSWKNQNFNRCAPRWMPAACRFLVFHGPMSGLRQGQRTMEAGMNRAMRIKRGLASARFGGRRAPFKSPCGRTGPMHGIAWQRLSTVHWQPSAVYAFRTVQKGSWLM